MIGSSFNFGYNCPHSKPFCALDFFCIEDDFLRIDSEKQNNWVKGEEHILCVFIYSGEHLESQIAFQEVG